MIQPKNQERYVCSGRVGDDNFVTLGLCDPGHIEEYQEFVNAFHDQISWAVKETYPGLNCISTQGFAKWVQKQGILPRRLTMPMRPAKHWNLVGEYQPGV